MQGTWGFRGDKMVWTYDTGKIGISTGNEDVNEFKSLGADKFALTEVDGSTTLFTRKR